MFKFSSLTAVIILSTYLFGFIILYNYVQNFLHITKILILRSIVAERENPLLLLLKYLEYKQNLATEINLICFMLTTFFYCVQFLFNIIIWPNLISVILFSTYILPNLGAGPLWPLVINHHAELCKKFMWRNFLFIHNYFGFENMCLTHTHQVGIDMQLFIFTPIIISFLWNRKKLGLFIMMTLSVISTVLRIWATWKYNLSHFIHFGITVSRMFDTANFSYILPTHRATVYLLGVYLAYILKFTTQNPNFTKVEMIMYWLFALLIGFFPIIGPFFMTRKDYIYNKYDAVVYGSLSPIFWGIGIFWVLYVSNKNYENWFTKFLAWHKFKYFSNIAYSVYLVQFPVFFYNVGTTRHTDEYKTYDMFSPFEMLTILFSSIILTLSIEIPFQNIKRIIFEKNTKGNRTMHRSTNKIEKHKIK